MSMVSGAAVEAPKLTRPQIRIPLAGLGELQKTNQDVCAGVHRALDELGPEQYRQ